MNWFVKNVISVIFGIIFITIIAIIIGFPVAYIFDKLGNMGLLSLSGLVILILLVCAFLDRPWRYRSDIEETKERNPFIK